MPPLIVLALLFFAGCLAGIMNTVGGGGSVLTLPALIFAGLPANAANAANRIGILAQNLVAITHFHHDGKIERALTWRAAAIGLAGAIPGAYLAARIPNPQFERILGYLFLGLILVLYLRPKVLPNKDISGAEGACANAWISLTRARKAAVLAAFFFLGFYAGFIQAGVGILFLVAIAWLVPVPLVYANYIKIVFTFILNAAALFTFHASGIAIEWKAGLAVTLGQALGASAGSWIALRKSERWSMTILALALILTSAKLLGWFEFHFWR